MFDLEKLKDAYCGDLCWLEEIGRQIVDNESKIENIEEVKNLLTTLFKMNYVMVETETEEYASKYNMAVADIYCQMKYDLTTMLGINEFWEMI